VLTPPEARYEPVATSAIREGVEAAEKEIKSPTFVPKEALI
jgi:hypothetical protein